MPGLSAVGRALALGARGHQFKSDSSDQIAMKKFVYPKIGDEVEYPWYVSDKIRSPSRGHYKYVLKNCINGRVFCFGDTALKGIIRSGRRLTKAMSWKIKTGKAKLHE